jgi:hypothetical protein
MSPTVEGGCLCGAVRLQAALPALWVAHCHCSMCRRAHGAGFVTWVGFPSAAVRIERGAADIVRYRSSARAMRSFCGRCGSTLLFESEHWPGETHIALANLDSAEGLEPTAHAYWSARVPWAEFAGRDLPAVEPPDHGAEGGD